MLQQLADKLVNVGKMYSRTTEGVLISTFGKKGVLFVPIPFNPGVVDAKSIDDYNTEYWVQRQSSTAITKDLELYRKTIRISIEKRDIVYTVYFADQTGNFPKNAVLRELALKSQYTDWLGSLLIIKSDENGHPIACNGNDTFYIPEAIERFMTTVNTESPYIKKK